MASHIPGYHITRLLGRGGMGAVYAGVQTSLDRPVAIKFLPPDLERDPEFAARFRREAKAMARLNHPNIVQIHDYGQASNRQHYFVMELVDGCDLNQLVRSGHLDIEGALNAIGQICDALQYAHEQGFVHRDIKPANILMNQQGVLKVGDFGLAKLLQGPTGSPRLSEDLSLTVSGCAMGTPNYAAPEQMNGRGEVDNRADLYSLGVMFYEMLTGELPRGVPKPPSRRVPHLDARLDGVVFKAMNPDPEGRYQSAIELRMEVDRIRTTPLPAPATLAAAQPPIGRRAGPRSKEDPLTATTRSLNNSMLTLGLVALSTIGTVAFFLAGRKTGDTISSETTVTNTTVHNSYFTQLIALGVTTASELEALGDIRPLGAGFVGISRQELSWSAVQELARRTGAAVFSTNNQNRRGAAWSTATSLSESSRGLWILEGEAPGVLVNGEVRLESDTTAHHRALLQWGAVNQPAPSERTSPAPAEEASATTGTVTDAGDPTIHAWTNTEGRTIRASFVRLVDDSVVIRMDGKEYSLPFGKLSPPSVELARRLGGSPP